MTNHADFEERAAIMEFDAGMTREEAERRAAEDCERQRHQCEVRDCIKRYYPDGHAAKSYFDECEKKRGKVAADRLRDDVRVAWKALA